jgi:hypothetical protein
MCVIRGFLRFFSFRKSKKNDEQAFKADQFVGAKSSKQV